MIMRTLIIFFNFKFEYAFTSCGNNPIEWKGDDMLPIMFVNPIHLKKINYKKFI